MKRFLMTTLGFLSLAVTPALADHHGDDSAQKHHKGKMFEKMDRNGDGEITRAEFQEAHEVRFEKMDLDDNGVVTKDEARSAYEKMRQKHKARKEGRGQAQED